MSYIRNLVCKKCHKKFPAMVPTNAKWVQCPNPDCKHMTKVKDH